MPDEHRGCALCRRRSLESFADADEREFCLVCVTALGDFSAQERWLASIWQAPPQPAPTPRQLRPPLAEAVDLDMLFMNEIAALPGPTEEDLATWLASPAEAETHLDLAIAYGEMGLWRDALGEVSIALQHADHLPRSRASEAVRMLLDPKWLRSSVEETLAFIRSAMFAN